jgi:hypothetical protein
MKSSEKKPHAKARSRKEEQKFFKPSWFSWRLGGFA